MSRCYPFPPPGYVRDESMIESIKGAKEEVKREKKDKKHKKDKKRKERENEADVSKKHRHKKRRRDESDKACKKVDDGRGLINNEAAELLEKSCLTVELEHQTSSQTSCDSTLRSNERLEQSQSLLLDGRYYDSETSIRILLHDKEQKYPEVMMTNKDQKQCSSLERLDASQAVLSESVAPQEKRRDPSFGSSRETTTKLSKEKRTVPLKDAKSRETGRETSMQLGEETPCSRRQETVDDSKLCSKCPPSTAVRFLNLVEKWAPVAPDKVESKLADSEDQEWWLFVKFGGKRHHQVVINQTTSNGSSSMLWPTARFLPEVKLHALPFTVPF